MSTGRSRQGRIMSCLLGRLELWARVGLRTGRSPATPLCLVVVASLLLIAPAGARVSQRREAWFRNAIHDRWGDSMRRVVERRHGRGPLAPWTARRRRERPSRHGPIWRRFRLSPDRRSLGTGRAVVSSRPDTVFDIVGDGDGLYRDAAALAWLAPPTRPAAARPCRPDSQRCRGRLIRASQSEAAETVETGDSPWVSKDRDAYLHALPGSPSD
jgi:hypothetical protein